MGRQGKYTALGHKIARLAKDQTELARVLSLSQQTVSGKLAGKIAITTTELETLSANFNVPMFYFFGPDNISLETARNWEKILRDPPSEIFEALELAATFPKPFAELVLEIVKSISGRVENFHEGAVDQEK